MLERLNEEGTKSQMMSFPRYEDATGKIIGECYLGKSGKSWFDEPTRLEPKVASLYYAADRLFHKPEIESIINSGTNLILDRYVESNMAHQGGKLSGNERRRFIGWVENLEYNLNNMPRPDKTIFLYVPTEVALELRKGRETSDAHESSLEHLKNAEETYVELSERFGWTKIECAPNGKMRTIDSIAEEVYQNLGILHDDKNR